MPSPSRTNNHWWADTASRYSQMLNTDEPIRVSIGATPAIDDSGRTFTVPPKIARDLTDTPAGEWVVARAICRHLQKQRTSTYRKILAVAAAMGALSIGLTLTSLPFFSAGNSLGIIFVVIAVILFFVAAAISRFASANLREINYHADLTATVTAGSDTAKDYFDRGGDQHRTLLHTYLLGELPTDILRQRLELD